MDMWPVNQDDFEDLTHAANDAFSTPESLESYSPAEDTMMKYSQDPPAIIAVMGMTGSGKTTFVNLASTSFLKVGEDLRSCTSEIQESREFMLDGRRVMLIDTPGFDDTHKSDTDVLKSIAAFLGESYSVGAKLAGVIYVHRISDDRFGGIAAKNFRMFRQLCGEKTLKNVILMTNMWGRVTPRQGAEREKQLRDEFFQAAIAKGAQLCRHDGTDKSARRILRGVVQNRPLALKIQRELIDEHKDIGQTSAGAELTREIRAVVERHQREIKDLEENMRIAMDAKDEESREEMEEMEKDRRRMQEKMEKVQRESTEMKSKFEDARREMEERINARVEAQVKRIREEYEAQIRQYQDKVRELEESGQENTHEISSLNTRMVELRRKAEEWRPCIIT